MVVPPLPPPKSLAPDLMSEPQTPSKGKRPATPESESSSSTGSEDQDNNWDDWVEDSQVFATLSLFENRQFPTAEAALSYDKETHEFDLVSVTTKLALDTHQRLRLINYIRSQRPSPTDLITLQGTEAFFTDDVYLKPVIQDDPLLQLQTDEWSEDEDEPSIQPKEKGSLSHNRANLEIRRLKERLAAAQKDLVDYHQLVNDNITNLAAGALGNVSLDEIKREELPPPGPRDDDTHYFESYNEQAIHWTMLTDRVRTSTYATFILSNPSLFRDAVVMDVGCGTGILSLLAARAGARRVFAVEASKIADKAEANIKASGYSDVITLIRGKVESISLPEDCPKVDVIISEWMGYALLYESMLDSVLVARDRFLRRKDQALAAPERPLGFKGVMVPSQCRMVLALCDPQGLIKQRVGFWRDVYGFDMSSMATEAFEEAIVECVPKEEVLSSSCIVKDLDLQTISSKDLSFSSSFVLKAKELPTSPAAKVKSGNAYFIGKLHAHRTFATAFVLWFDTFFHPTGEQYPEHVSCKVHTNEEGEWETGDVIKLKPSAKRRKTLEQAARPTLPPREVAAEHSSEQVNETLPKSVEPEARPTPTQDNATKMPEVEFETSREESFTTGPHGTPTHWKQAVFLLKTPIELSRGTEIRGTFYCRKSDSNSRELDFEFHFVTVNPLASPAGESTSSGTPTVQCFKVR